MGVYIDRGYRATLVGGSGKRGMCILFIEIEELPRTEPVGFSPISMKRMHIPRLPDTAIEICKQKKQPVRAAFFHKYFST
jgi:hypothetical protein